MTPFRPLYALLLVLFLSACTTLPGPESAARTPLVHDGNARTGVDKAIVVVPGAFASIGIFAPVFEWNVPDSTVVAYRFPGLDGLPLDHRVDIEGSAQMIADAINGLGAEQVYLIGFSTGGPIALEAARRIEAQDISLALVAAAGDFPASLWSVARGGVDVVQAMIRARSLNPAEAWAENFRTLLYGRNHYKNKELAEVSAKDVEAEKEHDGGAFNTPSPRLTMAHTASLLAWSLDRPLTGLDNVRIGFFHGSEDPVFPLTREEHFASRLHADKFYIYEGQAHLLYATSGRLFDDIRAFFDLE